MARRSNQPVARELTEGQLAVIAALLEGKGDAESGSIAGVDRATVESWRLHDKKFRATLNRQRLDLWGAQVERLRSLVSLAVSVLESDLQNTEDSRLRQAAAVHLLRAVRIYGEVPNPDPDINESQIFDFDL